MTEQASTSSADSSQAAGPVGQGEYVVAAGDCMDSIAKDHGYFWETLWDLPENAELKRVRRDPNILLPGDRVTVPPVRSKEEAGGTETRHRFKRRGVPAKLRLQLFEPEPHPRRGSASAGQGPATGAAGDTGASSRQTSQDGQPRQRPRANIPYVLDIDGTLTDGTTDGQGRIECSIPPNAARGRLILHPGTTRQEIIPLRLGEMDPVTEICGVRKRLQNIGYPCGEGDEMTGDLEEALSRFQEANGLTVTGRPDQATRDKLLELHGS